MQTIRSNIIQTTLAGLLVAGLAGCGGGSSTTTTGGGGGGGGGGGTSALTISSSYNPAITGAVSFATATGTNTADAVSGVPVCALRFSGVKVGTSTDSFDLNLYFKQSDGSNAFFGIFDSTNFLSFNMTTDSAAEDAKFSVNLATKTATLNNVLLKSNENAANKATISGSFTFPASATAACGT